MSKKSLPYRVRTKIRTVVYLGVTADIFKKLYEGTFRRPYPTIDIAWHVSDWKGSEWGETEPLDLDQMRWCGDGWMLETESFIEAWETVDQWAKDDIDKLISSFRRCVDEELREDSDDHE